MPGWIKCPHCGAAIDIDSIDAEEVIESINEMPFWSDRDICYTPTEEEERDEPPV